MSTYSLVEQALQKLPLAAAHERLDKLSDEQVRGLYQYRIPLRAEDTECSLVMELEPEPFDLISSIYKAIEGKNADATLLRRHPTSVRLLRLNEVRRDEQIIECDTAMLCLYVIPRLLLYYNLTYHLFHISSF
jgi:hypothetical protein